MKLYAAGEFDRTVGQRDPRELKSLHAWYVSMGARPSARE